MNIDKLFDDENYLNQELEFFLKKKHILKIERNKELAKSFLKKAKHNLNFYKLNKKNNDFNDWLIVILYYSLYHTGLALITNKQYTSKNHYATILILIKEYGISKQEADLINNLSINKEDAELYTNLKTDRHYASYQTNKAFTEETIASYEKQVLDFMQKAEDIIEND
jgi:uncharacterized protein (UPF0332 family)